MLLFNHIRSRHPPFHSCVRKIRGPLQVGVNLDFPLKPSNLGFPNPFKTPVIDQELCAVFLIFEQGVPPLQKLLRRQGGYALEVGTWFRMVVQGNEKEHNHLGGSKSFRKRRETYGLYVHKKALVKKGENNQKQKEELPAPPPTPTRSGSLYRVSLKAGEVEAWPSISS